MKKFFENCVKVFGIDEKTAIYMALLNINKNF